MSPDAFTEARVHYVRVTNNTDEVWGDRFDGQPIVLKPGESEKIPLEMAMHFFGYHPGVEPHAMLGHMFRRRGGPSAKQIAENEDWAHIVLDPEARKRLAPAFFAKFRIEPVIYKLVEQTEPDPHEPVPAISETTLGEQLDPREREPTAVKELAKAGMKDPEAKPAQSPGRGHPRQDDHGRRRG